ALDVPVAGSDRMVLSEQLPVMDLMALGRFVLLPEDDLNLAVVLKGPFVGLAEDALFDLAHGRAKTVWGELRAKADQRDDFGKAFEILSELLGQADTMPPYQFFAEFLAAGGRRQIVQRLGAEANDPIDELLAAALEFERTHAASLQGFLHWLDFTGTDIKRDLEAARNEVRIMTIHGAKGLQAPMVILPDTCAIPVKRDPVLWADDGTSMVLRPGKDSADAYTLDLMEAADRRQMEEYNRLLYVALTRAEDRLVVCGWDTKTKRPENCWYTLIESGLETLADGEDLPGDVRRWSQAQTADPDMDRGDTVSKEVAAPAPDWLGTSLAPDEPDPPRPLAPSRPDGEEPPALSPLSHGTGAQVGAGLRRGVLIHRMLQLLADVPDDRRDGAAAKFIAGARGLGFGATATEEMVATTLAVLRDPGFSEVFGPGSRAEVSVAGSVGGTVISGQIDRLVVTDHEILIVDFKTHRPAPADETAVPAIYLRQMAAYRGAIQQIYPGIPVRCALLWTDGPRLMPLAMQALDAAAP
ncbi:MAG: double-strand break repair helicase AddA, partial [Alphaproteobacteria bacterium]|nr:double-strand break repair helicase AddA [Alphaproteobacteria bacterium]